MEISVRVMAAAMGAETAGDNSLLDTRISRALTDSRSIVDPAATVFFALSTDTGDGHRYIPALARQGVRVFVVDKARKLAPPSGTVFLEVENVYDAFYAAADLQRHFMGATGAVIGITGSRGKTVVKEMLFAALAPLFTVARSPRSYNSAIGVPLSMWQITDRTEIAVFEAGISHGGEMERLNGLIRPTVGVFTGLGDEHSRGFVSREDKMRQKALLFRDCETIVYEDSDPLAGKILTELYSDDMTTLVPCRGHAEIVRVVARLFGAHITQIPAPVEGRIDFTESADNAMIAFDRFTCDLSGIETALADTVRRRSPAGHRLTLIVGQPLCTAGKEEKAHAGLLKLAKEFGVHELITDAPEYIMATRRPADFYNTTVYINGRDKESYRQLYTWLSSRRNITRMEVNLDRLADNFRHYRQLLPPQTGLIAMIKAAAYGTGDLEVARTLQSIGADAVAVAVVDEGVALRRGGVSLPILVLDPWCENMRAIFAHNLQPTIISPDEGILRTLEECADAEGVTGPIRVHLKLDTGMHRVGLHSDQLPAFVELLRKHPRIHIESMFSHLATADCLDRDDYTEGQLKTFREMTDYMLEHLDYPAKRHILNTAGITRYGHEHVYELARLGVGLYGLSPLGDDDQAALKPVARLVSSVINTAVYPAGATVGYGCHGVLNRPSVIATVPVGYADGIDRRLGNGGAQFSIRGRLCPTVGNICMDLCMVDVTDVPGVAVGDEVEIFGDNAPIQRISDTLGTIHYEVLARISPRVKRVYYRE